MTRSELIDLMLVRTAHSARPQLRRTLEAKSTDELEQMHREIVLEAADDELIRIQGEREADRVIHRWHMDQARQPQREAEDKRQLAEDRKTFLEACRQYHIGSTDANFGLTRSTLGPAFSTYDIGHALQSGTLQVSPATPEEIQQRTQEAEEQRREDLRSMSPEELRKVVRHEAEQRRAQAQREDAERQIAHREVLDAQFGFPPLPETNQSGDKIDAAYLTKISNTDLDLFKRLIRMYGAANLTARLRGIR